MHLLIMIHLYYRNNLFPFLELNKIHKKAGFRNRIRINLSCWIRIRIQIADPDPDPGVQKMTHKNRKSTEFLFVLFWGLKASSVAWASFMEA